jgi:tetratricopeptide (TPR) repeat protein
MTDFPDLHSLLGIHELPKSQVDGHLFAQALEYLQKGGAEQAQQICTQILAQNPEEPYALELLGMIAIEQKNYASAVDYLAHAIKVRPNHFSAYFNLGQVLLLTKQFAHAEKAFVRVLKFVPNMAAAQLGLGQALGYLGQFEAALHNLDLAIAQIDKLSASDAGLAWMHKGMAQGALAQAQAAISSFKHAISLNPQLAQAHFGLANTLLVIGEMGDAEQSVAQTLALDNAYAPAHHLQGMLLSQRHQYESALQCFDRAIELMPKLADAHYGRNEVLQAMEKSRAASSAPMVYRVVGT